MKILFFIESLRCGGKERRLLELIRYLGDNTDYKMLLVLTEEEIHYKYVYDLKVDVRIIKRRFLKKDPRLFIRFFRLCNEFKPDVIHTWGSMLAFYALPVVILKKVYHINGHIADAPVNPVKHGFHHMVTEIGFRYSDIILANSYAGLKSYGVSGEKCRVIYNGIRLDRFDNFPDRQSVKARFNINTEYAVIMVASFTSNKKYDRFLDVAGLFMSLRNDLTFIGLGDINEDPSEFEKIKDKAGGLSNVLLLEKIDNVESLVSACDLGVLFTYSEGISNAILEYMACSKPVIADGAGGTREVIVDDKTGFLTDGESTEEIVDLINELLGDIKKRETIGNNARMHVEKNFSIERMGNDFDKLYSEVLAGKKNSNLVV